MWNTIQRSSGRVIALGYLHLLMGGVPWFKWMENMGNEKDNVLHILPSLVDTGFLSGPKESQQKQSVPLVSLLYCLY